MCSSDLKPMATEGQGVRMGWGIFHLFPTKDVQQVFIAVTSNAHWERFCQAFGLDDLLADETLDSNPKRAAAQPRVLPRVQAETLKYTRDELLAKLEAANIGCAPVNRPDQLIDDPHLKASGQLIETRFPTGGRGGVPKMPFKSSRYEMGMRRPAPGLGEHTRELLVEAGYDDTEIAALVGEGVVELGQAIKLG